MAGVFVDPALVWVGGEVLAGGEELAGREDSWHVSMCIVHCIIHIDSLVLLRLGAHAREG